MASTVPDAAYLSAATPRCFVNIYTQEGGKYVFTDQDPTLQAVSTNASVQGIGSGFEILLAPGGPNGISARPSWAEILTPMSLVTIGMTRGAFARITMVGVVKSCVEDSSREVGGSSRQISVQGDSFSVYFNAFNYYNLATMTGLNGGILGDLGYLSSLSESLTHGTPDQMGKAWFTNVMAGPKGILADTQFPYRDTTLKFGDLMATVFEPYPAAVTIPMSTDFLGTGSFASKFQSFFPFPWYDLFLTTAPAATYAKVPGYTAAKSVISMDGFVDASPTLVARVNPLPTTTAQTAQYTATFALDLSRWNALTINQPYGHGHRKFTNTWDDAEVRNFYVINPLLLSRQFGITNASNSPFMYTFASWIDNASIHRYGFRPQITETHWFSDPTGVAAQQNAKGGATEDSFHQLVSGLALKVTSYHEPTPLMTRGEFVGELRPDIMEGTRFAYAPYRDGVEWNYYVETVRHQYVHGGRSVTTLGLTRGLPKSVYEDADLLLQVHLGNAMRKDGVLVKGLPTGAGDPLSSLNFATVQHLLADNALMFGTPQANTPATNPLRPSP